MGQCNPHVHFSSANLLFCDLGKTIAWQIAANWGGTSVFSTFTVGAGIGGIGQSALASNRFMEAGIVLGQGVSSLTWMVGVLGAALCYVRQCWSRGNAFLNWSDMSRGKFTACVF